MTLRLEFVYKKILNWMNKYCILVIKYWARPKLVNFLIVINKYISFVETRINC